MKVKKVVIEDRTVKVYSIYDLRNEFLKLVETNKWKYDLIMKVITTPSNHDYLEGHLYVTDDKGNKIREINYQMLIDDINEMRNNDVVSKSFEFSKRQTRLEKKLYVSFLGLPDPEEAEEEKEYKKTTKTK